MKREKKIEGKNTSSQRVASFHIKKPSPGNRSVASLLPNVTKVMLEVLTSGIPSPVKRRELPQVRNLAQNEKWVQRPALTTSDLKGIAKNLWQGQPAPVCEVGTKRNQFISN